MRNKKTILLILIGIVTLSFSILFISGNDYIKDTDVGILKTNDYYDESYGIPITGATDNIFSMCEWSGDMEHTFLYFYNTSLDGSLYKVDLNNIASPILVRGYLGVVYDIDTSYAPGGDMIFFATSGYDNAIMKMNATTLVYEKILSSTSIPLKLSVEYDYRWNSMFIAWRTASNVFAWNAVTKITYNLETGFYGVIDVQCEGYEILCYNSEEILIHNTQFTPTLRKSINDVGIKSVFWDTYRDYIVYAQDDDYSTTKDGKIIQVDYSDLSVITIQTEIDYPVSVWCTGNYIYWLERGYWSGHSMIYRYSYYYNSPPETHYYSKVSSATGNMWADRIEFSDSGYSHIKLGVYWGYDQLYVVNSSDITPPDTIEWMPKTGYDKTVSYDSWSITWWNSWDLNGIEDYELIVSETEDFSNYDTYWVSESEYSYTSLEFSDMGYGDYYYKVRTRDTMGIDPMEESNIGEWSAILKVSYPDPTNPIDPVDPNGIPSFNPLIIIGIIGSISVISAIVIRKRINK
ncbi:hypothetical protein ES705_22509 [subsurface metagenome]